MRTCLYTGSTCHLDPVQKKCRQAHCLPRRTKERCHGQDQRLEHAGDDCSASIVGTATHHVSLACCWAHLWLMTTSAMARMSWSCSAARQARRSASLPYAVFRLSRSCGICGMTVTVGCASTERDFLSIRCDVWSVQCTICRAMFDLPLMLVKQQAHLWHIALLCNRVAWRRQPHSSHAALRQLSRMPRQLLQPAWLPVTVPLCVRLPVEALKCDSDTRVG